ncbi:hypothetical protein [Streptosporangium sp. NPDC087985]|uniref:hypothetical protein n=1 Tax=Streptosporangium sp. NPDC087985 TaxID=3366196 RepID=UPI003819B0BC
MKLVKTAVAAAALIGATAVPLTLTATPAAAASCSGSHIDHLAVKTSGGSVYGYLDLYYGSGVNCAQLNRSVDYGVASNGQNMGMIVQMWACAKGSSSSSCTSNALDHDSDSGHFSYYAGPITVNGTNRCIKVQASIQDKNYNWANLTTPVFHCG